MLSFSCHDLYPTSIHRLPSSWSKFIDNPNSKAGHGFPVAISLSCSSLGGVGETVKSNRPGESNRRSGSENKKDKERRDRPEDEGATNYSGSLDGDGGDESWTAEISFDVSTDLLEPEADSPFQSLPTMGKIVITVWLCFFKLYFHSELPEDPCIHQKFPTCHSRFTDYGVSNQQVGKVTTPYYTHSHTSVVIDSLQAVANTNHRKRQ